MKKRKLKGFVLPTVYVLVIGVLFISISFLGNALQSQNKYANDLSVNALNDTDAKPVIKNEENIETAKIIKPYNSESVNISKSFYSKDDDEQKQQNSLVYYEQTYLQNSGVLYSSKETFDILNAYDGTVSNISEDEILGKVIEITHNTNLKTVYYSLGEINVQKDDFVTAGTIIGKSGDNLLTDESENCLLFEVYYNGNAINPEEFYTMNTNDLQ